MRGRAAKVTGGAGPIRLASDTKWHLATPINSARMTLALWLLYQSRSPGVAQTFLAAGEQANGDRGIHLYQEDGSRPELTFRVTAGRRWCTVTFRVPQRVWKHLIFTWTRVGSGFPSHITAYRDGEIIKDLLVDQCHDGLIPDKPGNDITLGSTELPTASFDDVIVWGETLTKFQVEKLFKFYKGKKNVILLVCGKFKIMQLSISTCSVTDLSFS